MFDALFDRTFYDLFESNQPSKGRKCQRWAASMDLYMGDKVWLRIIIKLNLFRQVLSQVNWTNSHVSFTVQSISA